ncbi:MULTISPECIES: mechanosensitive ion channel domain-containing protein [Corynebacterium]|uniref:mechanosensitive ion channel domain-containing protein n=1 Tax=Corynebacterium TaxID=1716 RepID=UPI00195C1297|nr:MULTISPECIES: mechanosensitive ion channel domain-containing protein [Corynebacterium]MDN8623735.1 mechanosensitive ion channel [Corynebacterium kroppenstedtii]QRQ64429.1 mechanosensitive ion channel family protein [Corynebacterium kroppenstedtii]
MPFKFYLTSMWEWVANTGLSLAILICIAILIPRIGRLVVRWATIKMNEHEERRGEIADTEGYKGRLAILGALVYIAEAIAFFFVAIRILKDFGFSTTGAAVPATVVSAAVAFGAQKIIADFLAGFFIITERQYGVGDWVILQNKDAPVEGTVTAITLRSTTVRTINGQEAVVPNSVPLVAVNASSGWAKAQIDIPVPLTAGDNTEDLNALFDGCVNRTLARPEIARLVSDDPDAVSILPALDLIPPTSAGVPWSIQYRVLIRVEPGQQWTVERALRSTVMDEMWASYSRSTIEGLPGVTQSLGDSQHRDGVGRADNPTGYGAHAPKTSDTDTATNGEKTQALDTTRRWAAPLQHEEDEFEGRSSATGVPWSISPKTTSGDGPNAGGNDSGSRTASDSETVVFPSASGSGSGSTSGSTAETRVFSAEDDTTAAERAAQASDHGVNPTDRGTSSADASDATTSKKAEDTRTSLEKEAEDAQQNGLFRRISYERRIQRLFSIGGRCRASTSAIVLVLIILVILQGLTYDGGDRGSGILAPSSFQSRSDKKESDDKSESSAPTTPESNTHSENPTTERDSNSENGSNTPTTTPNRTQPTTTATNTENNRNQQNSTNGNQNSGNNGNTGSNSDEDNSGTGGANQQDTDSSNQGSGSGNSNTGNDNSGQMNLSHAQGGNNTASTMAP